MEKKLTRRESRETAFLTAFAATFEPEEPTVPAEEHAAPDAFANQLLAAMNDHAAELDEIITAHLKGWTLSRVPRVSLVALRLALAEMLYGDEQKPGVAINEAVELVKYLKDGEYKAAAEAAATEEDKKKDGGWFNKKAREMEAVKAKLDAAEKNAAQAKDQLLRMAAEYDNYRKRSTREADQKFGDGVSHAVEKIIPILDTLDMAANAPTTDENYKKGVVMTLDKAAKALDALHVEEIEVLGKPFDPNLMNAVQQIPAPDGQESGTVVTVFQKGYKLGDKIIRHATVVVAE